MKNVKQGTSILCFVLTALGVAQAQDFGDMFGAATRGDRAALKYLEGLANSSDPAAQLDLGWMYENGEGVAKDLAQAVRWYRKAADQGMDRAQYNLGVMYLAGEGLSKDPAEALSWFRKAAEQGHADAQINMGAMYYSGIGVAKDDAQAAEWYRKAAEQGYGGAAYALGWMYVNGYGVQKDEAVALRWLLEGAKKNFVESQLYVARMYARGEGAPKDLTKAVEWFRAASVFQIDGPQEELLRLESGLGEAYESGSGEPKIPRDLVIAYMWYDLVAARGDETAVKHKAAVEKQMTVQQLAEAQELIREWKRKE